MRTYHNTRCPSRSSRSAALGLFAMAYLSATAAGPGLSAAAAVKSGGMSILIIGDSNTEFGRIAVGLTDTLQRYYGVAGSGYGYIPMFSTFLALRDKIYTGISIGYDSKWKLYDMYEGSRLTPPFLSPNGHWLKSTTVDAAATVNYSGNGIDVYWLAQANGGTFTVSIDNAVKATVATAGPAFSVQKTSVTGIAAGSHVCAMKVTALPSQGAVTLLGIDAHKDVEGRDKRSVVHNWGNGWAATQDYVGIDSVVFATGLQKLAPDVVVLLLGTNDHLQDSRSAANVKTNLKRILNRIKASGATPNILEVSTFMTNNATGTKFVPQYRATSWPEAASETGTAYWDMSTWFGPWNAAQMADENHTNQAGGKKIGIEMLNQILAKFPGAATRVGPSAGSGRDAGMVSFQGGWLDLRPEGDMPWEVEMVGMNGVSVARISGKSGQVLRPGLGALAAPKGVYALKVRVGNVRRCLRVPVIQ